MHIIERFIIERINFRCRLQRHERGGSEDALFRILRPRIMALSRIGKLSERLISTYMLASIIHTFQHDTHIKSNIFLFIHLFSHPRASRQQRQSAPCARIRDNNYASSCSTCRSLPDPYFHIYHLLCIHVTRFEFAFLRVTSANDITAEQFLFAPTNIFIVPISDDRNIGPLAVSPSSLSPFIERKLQLARARSSRGTQLLRANIWRYHSRGARARMRVAHCEYFFSARFFSPCFILSLFSLTRRTICPIYFCRERARVRGRVARETRHPRIRAAHEYTDEFRDFLRHRSRG